MMRGREPTHHVLELKELREDYLKYPEALGQMKKFAEKKKSVCWKLSFFSLLVILFLAIFMK